jgi:hypothetical protein
LGECRFTLAPIHGKGEDEDADHDRGRCGLHEEVHAHGRANGRKPARFRQPIQALIQVSDLAEQADLSAIFVLIQVKSGTRDAEGPFQGAMENAPHNEPSEVTAEEGEVMMDGPNGHAVSFTPEAALETSERLLRGGLKAQGQIVEARRRAGKADDSKD